MEELGLRGKRDPEVRRVVEMMYGYWRRGLEKMVVSGLEEGTFRRELGREEILTMLLCLLSGAANCRGDEFEAVARGIERWLLSDEVWKATRGAER
jgi:hypothetical protein